MSPTDPDPALAADGHALLKEGACSYLKALTALTIFRQDVQLICRKAVERRLTEFSRALGVADLETEPIVACATPEDQFNGSSAYLGARQRISRRKQSSLGLSCSLYCCLSWQLLGQGPWFGCWVSMWFNRREEADRVSAGFRRNQVSLPSALELHADRNEVWLTRPLKPGDMASLGERLDEVLVEWIRLWNEFGGLSVLAPDQT